MLRAEFQLSTPAFIGGALASERAAPADSQVALRMGPLIGQIRRWWWDWADRASGLSDDERNRLGTALFGAAAGSNTGGQGAFLLRLTAIGPGLGPYPRDSAFQQSKVPNTLANCETWYGPLWTRRHNVIWAARDEERRFTVEAIPRPRLPTDWQFPRERLMDEMGRGLTLLGLLGGVGSGNRRGFGALALTSLAREGTAVFRAPTSSVEYARALCAAWAAAPEAQRNGSLPDIDYVTLTVASGTDVLALCGTQIASVPAAASLHPQMRIAILSDQTSSKRRPSPVIFHPHPLVGQSGQPSPFLLACTTLDDRPCPATPHIRALNAAVSSGWTTLACNHRASGGAG